MAIRREEVERIAELARLEIDPARIDVVASQLSRVLDFVAQLEKLELTGETGGSDGPGERALRDDGLDGRRLGAEIATTNAPEAEHGFFMVPPIVENVNP